MTLQDASPKVFSLLLLLLGISVAVMFPTRMLATYISAHQRWDLYNAAGIVATITRAITIIVVLKLGYAILAVAVVTVVVSILSLGLHAIFVWIADSNVRVRMNLVSARRIHELFGFSLRSLLISVGDYLRFYSDSAVIAAVLTVALVTPFNVATRLIECFKSVVIAAGGPVLGTMTELDGACRQKELRQLLLQSTRLLGLLAVLGGSLLLIDGRSLLRLWVGHDMVSAYPLIAILAVGYTINLVQHPTLLIVIAKGSHGPLGAWTIAEGVANILLSVIWGRSHGLLGVAMGTVVPMLVIKIAIQPYYALKAAEMSLSEYLRGAIIRPLLIGVLFGFINTKITIGSENNILLFAGMVFAQTLVFAVFAWFFGITKIERHWVSTYVRKRLHWPMLPLAVLKTQSSEADIR